MMNRIRNGIIWLAVAVLVSACGTVTAHMHVTHEASGETTWMLDATAPVMLEALLTEIVDTDRWQAAGAHADIVSDDESVTVNVRWVEPPSADTVRDGGLYEIVTNPHPLCTDYAFRYTFENAYDPASLVAVWAPYGEDEQATAETGLDLTLAATLPGRITATNADQVTQDTAVWHVSIGDLARGREMYAHSRAWAYGRIVAAGLAAVAPLGIRRRSRDTSPEKDVR